MSERDLKKNLELLSKLKSDPRVEVVTRALPWDKDIELVDVYVKGDSEQVEKSYLEDKSRIGVTRSEKPRSSGKLPCSRIQQSQRNRDSPLCEAGPQVYL